MNKFKFYFLLIFFVGLGILSYSQETMYFHEGFESGTQPAGWTYQYVSGSVDWQYLDGGFTTNPTLPGSGHPPYAYQGYYNAMFHVQNLSGETTKFITPPIDLSYGIKPELAFWHAQDKRYTLGEFRNDELKVYVRKNKKASWVKIKDYTETVVSWTERNLFIPDTLLSDSVYIAFEGKTNNGWGVCIDSVTVIEKGIIPRYIESLAIKQASKDFVPTGSQKNDILRIDFSVKGNDGVLILDSIVVKSLNTDDIDISANGVKLYASNDTLFQNSVIIGSSINFSGGVALFDNLNRIFSTGLSSIWVTYDIKNDTEHKIHEHILDAMIMKESIKINNAVYPAVDVSPAGNRIIYEALIFDDFESEKGWVLTGEFQRGSPQGKGGSIGNPDPSAASSGLNVLGSDLTGLGSYQGDYEFYLPDRAYTATSPYINCKYYKDLYLYFDRWLNVDGSDTVTIDFATSTKNNWQKYWQNSGTLITNQWTPMRYSISSAVSRKDSVQVRFTVGPTNDFWNFSGWNIDDVVIVGNYISKDVGITNWIAPLDGCGHTNEEYVTVTIKNFAGDPLTDPLPLSYSFDGGTTIYRDTIEAPNLAVDGTLTYQIAIPIDLTIPGWYNNVYATTNLASDEDATNNRFNTTIFIAPTYTLPYTQNFETNYGYYRKGGTNSSWAYGTPAGTVINSAASGTKAWVTSLASNYNIAENSYLESPCFNFAGIDYPVFEFKSKGLSEDTVDGLALYYSLNDGQSWSLVPNNGDFNWNWYNETNISALGTAGIDSTDNIWKTFRQLLPAAVRNQSSVKFRFVFKSDAANNYEGFGIDDIKIYDAPGDVGVTAITYPITKCELSDTTHLKVNIKNFGLDTLKTGTKIPVGYKFNNGTTKRDTLVLASNLIPNATRNFTFNSTVDMSYSGDYTFAVFTTLESNPFLYSSICNDTIRDTISVTGMPRYNIGNIMGVPTPIDTFIVAGTGYLSYNWTGGGISDYTPPADTLYVDAEGWYKVTVTNDSLCTATDSVRVVPSLIDLKMDTLYTIMKDSCERFALTEIKVNILNKGLIDFNVSDSIYFGYKVNNNPIVYDTLFLTRKLEFIPDNDLDTISFTFAELADLRAPGEYKITVFTNFENDLFPSDDRITSIVNTWGLPYVDLAYDSISSSQADTLLLIANPGFIYSWNTTPIVNNDTLEVPNNESRWYVVTVTDAHACDTDKDSTYINAYDYGITRVVSPVNDCSHLAATQMQLNVINFSGNNYLTGDSIKFKYNFNNSGWISQKYVLTSSFAANDSMKITLPNTINASTIDDYTLSVCIDSKMDANHSNDTVLHSFATWGYPEVNLAYDTIYTTQADTVVLVANPGFATYEWNDASDNDSLIIIDKSSQKYVVTVTDINGCGTDKDSTQIITYDFALNSIELPKNSCSHTSAETVRIVIKNISSDMFVAGTKIPVAYIFNEGTPVKEEITLVANLNTTQSIIYNFNQKVDMSAIGTYTLKAYVDFPHDVNHQNDTTYEGIKTFGYPTVEIGPDIYTNQPDTVILVANPGYNNYTWNEGTKNDTLRVTKPESFKYIVTVTDINGCATKDSASVFTTNISASALIAPVSKCELTNSEIVIVTVLNNGYDTIPEGETISVSYRLTNGSLVTESHVLEEDLDPNGTVNHSFTTPIDLSVYQNYTFRVFAKYSIDVNTNDTSSVTVEFRRPNLNMGPDVFSTDEEVIINAGSGYSSYLWFDGSTNQTYTVNVNNQRSNYFYPVTVTNSFGCSATDSIMVTFNVSPDLSVTDLVSPESDCLSDSLYYIDVEITNSGGLDIAASNNISVSYKIDNGTAITENHVLASALYTGTSVVHRFAGRITLTTAKVYQFKTYLSYAGDGTLTNDTLVSSVTISAPSFTFNSDTVKVSAYPYNIDPGVWASYLWQNGSTSRLFSVSTDGLYKVKVTDGTGCSATDSIYVKLATGTGIDGKIHGENFVLSYYPNPVQDQLSINIDAYKPVDLVIELLNTHGQVLYNKQIKNAEQLVEKFYVGDYAKGVYYIRFTIGKESFVRKVVIQ
ncbi:MAG: hypothetical protein A2W99_00485 [Bacteroidetes bacterium GWF2_33_16]|nr:MAG: hypothetical protein A2X00_03190 [Bacteroidetes bacterium GWE2_32_14]OFY08749.1 MAG: hypothetical protein A2W99_00485 [Bacteroidetes bacterium GWF2_33_16]